MRIQAIIAENWKMDGGATFGVVPRTIWEKLIRPDENNLIPITSRCLLVDEGSRKILIDTGMGNKQSEKYYSYRHLSGGFMLMDSLAAAGYAADEITDVVFTHLHDDHCGGAVSLASDRELQLVFPNAIHYVSRSQWDWANQPNSREIGSFFNINFRPIEKSGKLTLIESPGKFSQTIELMIMNGHTEGQLIPKIHLAGMTFVFTADFIPSVAHIPLPYIASVDIRPLVSLREKEDFLEEASTKGYYLIFEHDLENECCTLIKTDKGIRMDRTYRLHEILN